MFCFGGLGSFVEGLLGGFLRAGFLLPGDLLAASWMLAGCLLLARELVVAACLLGDLLRISWTAGDLSFTRGRSYALSVPVPAQVYRLRFCCRPIWRWRKALGAFYEPGVSV